MRHINYLILTVAMLLSAVCVQAQDKNDRRQKREHMVETQASYIADELALDEKTRSKFIETYTSYKKEMWQSMPKRPKGKPQGSGTEEEAKTRMRERFDNSRKMLDIQDKYYKRFSKFMTQKQIEKMYDKENEMMRKLHKHHGAKGRPMQGKPGMGVGPQKKAADKQKNK